MGISIAQKTEATQEKHAKAALYDALRKQIPFIRRPNILVITQGVQAEFEDRIQEVMQKVKAFNSFTEANDPWKEHDFGAFEIDNQKIFWKIDDYGGIDGYNLILTIMLASEY